MSEEPIAFAGRLTEDDFVRLQSELSRGARVLLLAVPVLGLLIAAMLMARAGFTAIALGAVLGGVVMLPVAFLLRRRTMRHLYRSNPALGEPLEGVVDERGIEFRTTAGAALLAWADVERVASSDDLLVAFDSPRSARPLLRRWFADDEAWAAVRELAAAHETGVRNRPQGNGS